jgi:hypothetical protein
LSCIAASTKTQELFVIAPDVADPFALDAEVMIRLAPSGVAIVRQG